ncbi:RNA-binding cell elongation regulator Jag/EloR [Alkalicoccus daliensis]|uniref:RNA-binding protein KhpB n=1 Tax=Alkalicoccus daliensis TaxID=745820 RepID=A0A1H0FNC3_9BACI|nr:RNA-binding cell elongation regulator Jag/EloR [Alkalicoccus daliensis]SDN96176.1 spoIIIJ-associated protein [Alkalicoccus daliensis]
MNKVTVSGKTVEEAILQGLEKLEAAKDDVNIHIIEEPQKGLFGLIGGKPAVVELVRKPDPVKEGLTFLRETIDKMGVAASVEKEEREEGLYFNITGKEIGVLIGKRGQTLDSLQYLVNLVANKQSESYLRIHLDAEGYRARRKEALEVLAHRLSKKSQRTKQEVRLEPMNAHERKIIHTALQHDTSVKTYSDGQEPNRRIIIAPK